MRKLSIVIPAFNEEDNIQLCVRNLHRHVKDIDHEIIVVNDGSTDNTLGALNGIKEKYNLTIINRLKGNNGFGKAIRVGLKSASGDYIVVLMADSSEDPRDIMKMVDKARQGKWDIIIGSRFKRECEVIHYPVLKLIANRLFNYLVSFLFKMPYYDVSNAFKMYKRDFIQSITIESNSFDITIELPIKAWLLGKKFTEVPTNWYGRKKGNPKWKLLKDGRLYIQRAFKLYMKGMEK